MYEGVCERYRYIVEQEAEKHRHTCPGLEYDDHVTAGMIGLIKAAQKYDPARGVPFDVCARPFVSGEIQHGMRGWRVAKPWLQDWQRSVLNTRAKLPAEATDAQLAEAMGVPLELFQSRQHLAHQSATPLSLEDLTTDSEGRGYDAAAPADGAPLPHHQAVSREDRDRLEAALARLPERQREVIRLYFTSPLTLREIGALIGLTESTVHAIKAAGLKALREELEAAGVAYPA